MTKLEFDLIKGLGVSYIFYTDIPHTVKVLCVKHFDSIPLFFFNDMHIREYVHMTGRLASYVQSSKPLDRIRYISI